MPASKYRPITLRPLTGIFDARSSADEKPPGAFSWKQNLSINKDGKLARAKGWRRFGDPVCPRNADWHDQGVIAESREPLTLLFPSTENDGTRRLIGGTKTRIIVLNESSGDWTTLNSGLGNDGNDSLTQLRFNAAELQNKVYFTNDFNAPFYVDLDNLGVGSQVIGDLATAGEDVNGNAVPITRVRRVISWNGVILFLNTVEGGTRFSSRIRWSDLNDGTLWKPGQPDDSIADFQDLDYGHEILNAVPIGTGLYVFTDRSIWRCTFTVDNTANTVALDTVRVYYEPRNKAKCLAYANSLVSDGDTAWYAGRDGIYSYRPGYSSEPELREWLHRSTSIIFDGGARTIDTSACNSMIGEFLKDNNEVHFSWPVWDPLAVPVGPGDVDCETYEPTGREPGSGFNIHTLVVNTKYETADYRDYGSTAMASFQSDVGGNECNQASQFISANSADLTLKELEQGSAREMYSITDDTHTMAGYFSLARGVFPFQQFDSEKEIEKFLVGVTPEDPTDTAVLRLRVGTSDVALDPNGANGRCGVLFHQLSNKPIRCHYTRSAAQYVVDNKRPDDAVDWRFFFRGRFLYYEITIAAANNSAPITGGLTLSRFEVSARLL